MSEELTTKLRAAGYSATKPRQQVFSVLKQHGTLTMAELVAHCVGIDRASVYRTVQLYEQLGFVRRVNSGWKYKLELSDLFTGHHHHIICSSCGTTHDLQDDPRLDSILHAMTSNLGYQVDSHDLEVRGLCRQCQTKTVDTK